MWRPLHVVAWRGLVLIAVVAGPWSARAVRLAARSPEGSPFVREQKQRQTAAHVPKLGRFQEMWARFRAKDGTTVPAGRLPSMVFGIFTTLGDKDAQYRKVIRSTWMQHPAVCTVADRELNRTERTANCSIFAAFVAGRGPEGTNTTDPAAEEDLVVLPVEENVNQGKTPKWFEWATEKYPWATHIAKMDMDAFVHVSGFLTHMRDASDPCPHVYGGMPHRSTCNLETNECPRSECFKRTMGDSRRYEIEADRECWRWMHGGFYYVSRELAANASKESTLWRSLGSRVKVDEDVLTGYALHEYSKEHGLCLTLQNVNRHHDVKHLAEDWR